MEQKYFISYVAYADNSKDKDFFNDIIYIDKEINPDLLTEIQGSLLKRVKETLGHKLYYATQIINIVKL